MSKLITYNGDDTVFSEFFDKFLRRGKEYSVHNLNDKTACVMFDDTRMIIVPRHMVTEVRV